ncbi:hypothetical protein EJB05_51801, partial [Eragrostis curvula]
EIRARYSTPTRRFHPSVPSPPGHHHYQLPPRPTTSPPLQEDTRRDTSSPSFPGSPRPHLAPATSQPATATAAAMGGEDAAVRAEESASGGVDVWSDAVSSHAPDHLLVMVHGILGSQQDWQYAANEFVKQLPDDVIVHCSEKNASMLTLDGVDVMGERLADEVLDVPLLFGSVAMENVASRIVHWIFRRTGRHLFLTDGDEDSNHCCSVWLKTMTILNLYLLCGHLNGEWHMQCGLLGESLSEKYPHVVHEEYSEEINDESAKIPRKTVIWTS